MPPDWFDRDAEWKAHAMGALKSIQRAQVEQGAVLRGLRAEKWLAVAIRSRGPSWLAAMALVGIALALIAR